MWPFTTRRERQLQAELDAVKADRERIRGERNQFAKDRDTARYNREQILRQLAEADATNRRLNGRVLELGRRNSELSESDPEYAAQLEHKAAELQKRLDRAASELAAVRKVEESLARQIHEMAQPVEPSDEEVDAAQLRLELDQAEARVKHLEKELDNALGMPAGGILASARWQPGYQDPTPDKQVAS